MSVIKAEHTLFGVRQRYRIGASHPHCAEEAVGVRLQQDEPADVVQQAAGVDVLLVEVLGEGGRLCEQPASDRGLEAVIPQPTRVKVIGSSSLNGLRDGRLDDEVLDDLDAENRAAKVDVCDWVLQSVERTVQVAKNLGGDGRVLIEH